MKQGWEIKRLSEIGKVYNGNSINEKVKKDNYSDLDDGFPYIATKDISYNSEINYENGIKIPFSEKNSFKIAPKNTVLICAEGGSAGRKIGFTNQEVCFGNKLFALAAKNDIESRYVYYYYFSETFQKHFSVELAGIIGGVSMNKFKDLEIPLPSLQEQQRIVAILDEAFAAIGKAKANAEQNLKNAKELFESYLQGVFENKGEGWEEKFLEDLADEKCTLSYGIVQPGDEFENGLPVIRPTDLTSRFIGLNRLKRIDPKLAEGYKRTKLIGDELLLCVRGTTGIVSIATEELKDANVTRGIVPIRFNSKIINQEFGYYLLISNYIQKQIKAKTYGAALMQINIGDLRKINTPFTNLKEQKLIVYKLDALFAETKKLEGIYKQKINDLEELKKSVLQKAFSGELKTEKALV
jgi:type I restriction enzyme S subunit